jgi:hypothetical protein
MARASAWHVARPIKRRLSAMRTLISLPPVSRLRFLAVLPLIAALAGTFPITAQFALLEDFESLAPGTLGGQAGWVSSTTAATVAVDPTDPGNQVLRIDTVSRTENIYRTATIRNPDTGTLFFRMRRGGKINASIGMTDVAVPGNQFGNYAAQLNCNADGTGNLRVNDGGTFRSVETFLPDTWYHVWMTIDNASDSYQVHLEGGSLTIPTLVAAGNQTTFKFRNSGGATLVDNDLVNLLIMVTSSDGGHSGPLLFDDLYLDPTGLNLTNPLSDGSRFVALNSTWTWRKGTSEASSPINAWRQLSFDDAGWDIGPAPFHYGEGITTGTELTDMRGNYACIFLRHPFHIADPDTVGSFTLRALCDDGFIAWINGTEIARYNMPAGERAYNSFAIAAVPEPVEFFEYPLPDPAGYLVPGANVLAVQVFNNQINSSDLQFNAELISSQPDIDPPLIVAIEPTPGVVGSLSAITVTFSEPVMGVDAGDLLIDGDPAIAVSGTGAQYTFQFPQPPYGLVRVTWDTGHGIADLALPPNPFDASALDWQYDLVDITPPEMTRINPPPGVAVRELDQIEITFSEPVQGIIAADLLLNGQPATTLVNLAANAYVFSFSPLPPGPVSVAWSANHGITDSAVPPNPFGGGTWSYTVNPDLALDEIRINEFLASNRAGLLDEDGDAEDWIELHNPGLETVSLAGWSLTDDPRRPGQWAFPLVTLGPDEYLVVFASGKDRRPDGGGELHTNFRLSAGGEYLGLFNAQAPRQVVSEFAPAFPEQRTDYSYGWDADGQLRYFAVPTPGAPNGFSAIEGIAATPHFNVERGLFGDPFELHLSTETIGGTIRYTLDGREPTSTQGLTYTGPLSVTTTRTVRAATFKDNTLPSRVATHTFLFPEHVLEQPPDPPGFPPTWGTDSSFPNNLVPADYEMDPDITLDPFYRSRLIEGLRSIPTLSLVLDVEEMFGSQGIYSNPERRTPSSPLSRVEKPVSAELIYPDGRRGFQIDAGLRIQGGASRQPRNSPKHSLRLLFKRDYGPGNLDFPLFQDAPARAFNTVILRAEYNNSWIHWDTQQRLRGSYVRDQWLRSTQVDMSGLGSHGNHVHLYINGLYWGLYNPSERGDAAFAATYLGGEREEYDAYTHRGVRDGDAAAWNTMFQLARQDLAQNANYEALGNFLDIPHFIDYMILNIYGGNEDWPHNNYNAVRHRSPGAGYKFICWDGERVLEGVTVNRSTVSGSNNPGELYNRLRANAEFRLLFADRLHRHLSPGGALTPASAAARYRAIADPIEWSVIGESARWGDYRRDVHVRNPPAYLFTYLDHWLPERDRLLGTYFPQRSAVVLNQFRSIGLYPELTAPTVQPFGGHLTASQTVQLAANTGTIYYTIDGSDPRLYGTGQIAPSALAYTAPLSFNHSTVLKARVRSGNTWSALVETTFTVGHRAPPLVISEVMYHPPTTDALQFVELFNAGNTPIDLGGFRLDGVDFLVPAGSIIAAGQAVAIASDLDPAAFAQRYPGVTVLGHFNGRLSHRGQRIAILDRQRSVVHAVWYEDRNGWPRAADGQGYSIELLDPHNDPNAPANWRASLLPGGSPDSGPQPFSTPIVRLNELMAHNLAAVEHAGSYPDWIELHNAGTASVDLAGWSLTDRDDPRRFVFPPGTSIAPGGFLIVWCDQNFDAPGLHSGFALSRHGESVFLYDPQTNRVDAVSFGPQLTNASLGRLSDGRWALTTPTPGAVNVAASVASADSLVLNEWLARSGSGQSDWLELYNTHESLPVALHGIVVGVDAARWPVRSLSFIQPRGHLILWADGQPGPNRLELRLPAAGGTLTLFNPTGVQVDRVDYGPQQVGVSQGRLPDGGSDIVSFPHSASPAAANYVVTRGAPLLNEIQVINRHTLAGPAGRFAGWIELYNPEAEPIPLSDLSLSVGAFQPGQWAFPIGSSIAAHGYALVWCDSGQPIAASFPGPWNLGLDLDPRGDRVYLFDEWGRQIDQVEFGFQVPDRSIGRSSQSWALLAEPTPAMPNSPSAALDSPHSLRINEWMAWLPGGDDWFELFHPGQYPVSLTGLHLTDDPRLSGRTQFEIGPLSFIAPRGFVLWTADSQSQRGAHHLNFALNRQGEMIGLFDTAHGWIDAVFFGAQTASVSEGRLPDGSSSIVRFPTHPTPGRSNLGESLDSDGDGIPDWWELAHGLNPFDPTDALLDLDDDGMNNLDEYLAGTDPRNPNSVLHLQLWLQPDGSIGLRFLAIAGQTYVMESSPQIHGDPWEPWTQFDPDSVNRIVELIHPNPDPSPARYFRLRTFRTPP